MKVSPKQYAILLYELTKDASKKDIKKQTQVFLNLLLKQRALNRLAKILLLYEQYYNVRENVVDVEVTTAGEVVKTVKQFITKNVGSGLAAPRTELRSGTVVPGRGGAQGPALQSAVRFVGEVPGRGGAPDAPEQQRGTSPRPTVRGRQGPALQIVFQVDSGVIGGARIKVGDYMMDDTLKARLRALRKNL